MDNQGQKKIIKKILFGASLFLLMLVFLPNNAEAASWTIIEDTDTKGIVKANFNIDEGIVHEGRIYFEMYYTFEQKHRIIEVPGWPIPFLKPYYVITARPSLNKPAISRIESEVLSFDGHIVEIQMNVNEGKEANYTKILNYDNDTGEIWWNYPRSAERKPIQPSRLYYFVCNYGVDFITWSQGALWGGVGTAIAVSAGVATGGAAIIGLAAGYVAQTALKTTLIGYCP